MQLAGRAHKFGDDINTDYIISSENKAKILDLDKLSEHIMEDIDNDFYHRLRKGDFIVAGKNFGCGSSRETAPVVIKRAGIVAVVAKSFARIFFRNAISIGLPVIECETDGIRDGEWLEINVEKGEIVTSRETIFATPLPRELLDNLIEGGMSKNFIWHRTFC